MAAAHAVYCLRGNTHCVVVLHYKLVALYFIMSCPSLPVPIFFSAKYVVVLIL